MLRKLFLLASAGVVAASPWELILMFNGEDSDCQGEPFLTYAYQMQAGRPCNPIPCAKVGQNNFAVSCAPTIPPLPADPNLFVVSDYTNDRCTGYFTSYLSLMPDACWGDPDFGYAYLGECMQGAAQNFLLQTCLNDNGDCGSGCNQSLWTTDSLCHPVQGQAGYYYKASASCGAVAGPCTCSGAQCACCETFQLPAFTLASCTNLTLINSNTIKVTFSVRGYTLYSTSVTVQNPTQCFTSPTLAGAQACLNFYALQTFSSGLGGCASIDFTMPSLLGGKTYEYSIGCFTLINPSAPAALLEEEEIVNDPAVYSGLKKHLLSLVHN
jgi:hypothetical protein